MLTPKKFAGYLRQLIIYFLWFWMRMSFAFFIPYLQEKQLTKKQTKRQKNRQQTNTNKQKNRKINRKTNIKTQKNPNKLRYKHTYNKQANTKQWPSFLKYLSIACWHCQMANKSFLFFFEGLHSHLSDWKYSIIRQSFSFGKEKERESNQSVNDT